MGYAIVGGCGVALGLSLMIWALRERQKRYAAERLADTAGKRRAEAQRLADSAASAASMLQAQVERLESALDDKRRELQAARQALAENAPIHVVEKWLDDEGEKA